VQAAHPLPSQARDPGALARAAVVTLLAGAGTVAGATVYLAARGIASPVEALVWQGATYLAWVPLAVAVAWLSARTRRPWLARILAFPPVTLVHAAASAGITWYVREAGLAQPTPFGRAVARHVVGELPVEILQYWAIVALLAAVEAQRRQRERERAVARLEAELTRAQLASLRARLQPHFLFNTLQSIALLIPREPDVARRMTVCLGDLLRAAFARGDGQEVALRDELALVRAYLEIEAQRFRDRLTVRWAADAAPAHALVPDLLLQPLVENALRHGLWPRPGRGALTVRAAVGRSAEAAAGSGAHLVLEVEDDGAGLPPGWIDGERDGVGLGATRARLLALYGPDAWLRVDRAPGGGTRASIGLPLRLDARPPLAPPALAGRGWEG
jgi:signal transduction histidine kinase